MQSSPQLQSLDIHGVPVSLFESYQHAEDMIVQRIRANHKTFCVAINAEKIYRSQEDNELKQLVNSADFHVCDGVGAALAVRILHRKKVTRVTGVQLFFNLMARAEKDGLKVFLLGANSESNEDAYKKLIERHPKLQIAGRQDGYFKKDLEVIQQINDSGADMLFVAMGSPRQEKWIYTYRSQINAPFCMGVGGTFDVASGNVKWAPKFFQRTGTESLYRNIAHRGWSKKTKLMKMRRDFAFLLLIIQEKCRRVKANVIRMWSVK